MTEYELTDVLVSYNTAAMSGLALYLTASSGYLIAAYMVGKELSRSQTFIISVLFVVFGLFFGYGTVGYLIRSLATAEALRVMNPGQYYGIQEWLVILAAGLLLAGMFACLKFMWDVRHLNE